MTITHSVLLGTPRVDLAGNASRTIRVYDDAGACVSISQAIAYINTSGLGFGTQLPGYNLFASSPVFQENTPVVDVQIEYVPSGQTVPNPPLNPLDPAFQSMDTTFRTERVQIPTFDVRTVRSRDPDGQAIEEKLVWAPAEPELPPFDKDVFVFIYRLNGTFTDQQAPPGWLTLSAFLQSQANRLHKFNGVYYRFRPRTISQESSTDGVNPARYRIEYEWEYDPGLEHANDFISSAGDQPLLRGDGARFYPVFDDTFYIPSWTNLAWGGHPDGPENAPIIVFRDAYIKDDNGWQTLPGIA